MWGVGGPTDPITSEELEKTLTRRELEGDTLTSESSSSACNSGSFSNSLHVEEVYDF